MTYSIVARDAATGQFGIAVASRFFAVGALVPHVRGGRAAVATQAFVNPRIGLIAADRIAAGEAAPGVLAALLAEDEGRDHRQVHMIDAAGRIAAHTGARCIDWAGQVSADGVSVAGNMLAGPDVVRAALASYLAHAALSLPERLMTAMEAGEAAGGDKRGRQSAALRVHRGEDYPWGDIRADDHGNPLAELRRLYDVAHERFLHFADAMATRENPSGLRDRSSLDLRIAEEERRRAAAGIPSRSLATPLPPT
ncbi:MAG: DUF1028 domain-containing protein [Hyphomicrobiaceae bacterium]